MSQPAEHLPVRTETEGPVTTIVMSRPKQRNAVDRAMAEQLREAFERFEADATQRVAVLWGEHGVFCAGADLAAVNDPARRNEVDPDGGRSGPMGPSRMALSKPLIAAIEGHAVAGGLELALQADLRVADTRAVLGVFCRRWGVPLIDGGTVRLPRIVGMARALDLILTGRPVAADEALAMGLVNRVCPRAARGRRQSSWRARSRPSPRPACWPTAPVPTRNGISRSPRPCDTKAAAAPR